MPMQISKRYELVAVDAPASGQDGDALHRFEVRLPAGFQVPAAEHGGQQGFPRLVDGDPVAHLHAFGQPGSLDALQDEYRRP